jgi:hypothetical protein
MRFINKTIHSDITRAIDDATKLLQGHSSLMEEIRTKNDFKFNSGTGREVYLRLLPLREPIDIFTFRSINPWSRSVGYFDGEAIHINTRKIDGLDHADMVGLLLHEFSHYCGFKHGNNYKTREKMLYSLPYWLSENVKRWL